MRAIEYKIVVDNGRFFRFRVWLARKLLYIKYAVEEEKPSAHGRPAKIPPSKKEKYTWTMRKGL